MKKAKGLILSVLLLLSATAILAQKYDTLAVYKQGGSIDKYATAQVDSIRYKGDTVFIRNSSSYISYHMNDLDSLVFVEKSSVVYCDTLTDYDGNQYYAVQIGAQCWMAENLKTTHYSDGTAIPLVTGDSNWAALPGNNADTARAYCWYNDDEATYKDLYGTLYTYAAATNGDNSGADVQGACPTGWHLPSDAEWIEMENYLADNGYNYDGTTGGGRAKIAKSLASTNGWNSSSNTGAVGNTDYPTYRNKSGFAALPGGYRDFDNGSFSNAGDYGYWWSSTEDIALYAWHRYMYYSFAEVRRYNDNKSYGFSVRCVRD